MISLVDGREYVIPAAGVVFGRDPSCDIVVGSTEVSRRHASLIPLPRATFCGTRARTECS